MEVKLVVAGKASEVFPFIKRLAEQEALLRDSREDVHEDRDLCPYCGMDFELEREMFGLDRAHSCRGLELAKVNDDKV